ncbi:MAG: gas vesicle protein K [Planctomycetota bacterium]
MSTPTAMNDWTTDDLPVSTETIAEAVTEAVTSENPRFDIDPDDVRRGLGQVVLTVVRLLHELMERQAERRIENETVSPEQAERLGLTLMRQAEEIDRLREHFGLDEDDLNLDLGPLGKLV